MLLPASFPFPASEKRFGFRRDFYNFHFVLVGGWLVCLLPNKYITYSRNGENMKNNCIGARTEGLVKLT